MVSSSARHALVDVENTLSTKRHQRWCLVVFGVCRWVQKTRRARKDTNNGVLSCSACVTGCRKHAEHEKTPSLVSFHVRHVWRGNEHENSPITGGFRGQCVTPVIQSLLVAMQG